MTRPVYERCLNPACQREQACQSEAFCIADAKKNIWNDAIEAAAKKAIDRGKWYKNNFDNIIEIEKSIARAIRALKRQ